MNKIIISLYDHYKNTNKKLKIVCDWDEVIQAHEPYAMWKLGEGQEQQVSFPKFFKHIWDTEGAICYSPYGSFVVLAPNRLEQQIQIKNSPNFYQQAPFLTIAKELLMLIKAGKVERLIFLSAYDKRKFPNGDPRKHKIFKETFRKLNGFKNKKSQGKDCKNKEVELAFFIPSIELQLIGFDSKEKGQTKADWIKENASDFDIVIDDNPIICGNIVHMAEVWKNNLVVIAPYYPAAAEQHSKLTLLVKTSVSDLTKEDFKDYGKDK